MKDVYPNFDSYAPWVKKLLVLKLFAPGGSQGSWMDHQLLIHRERKGQMVGSLEREAIIEMRTKWMEMALPYLENPAVSDGDRKKLQKDIDAVKWAGICLDRLVEHDANAMPLAADPQDNPFVPQAPIEGGPASGENDQADRGETLEPPEKDLKLEFDKIKEAINQGPEFTIGEGQSQPQEPAPPPVAPLATRAQDSSEAGESSTPVPIDPRFIRTREQFIAACELANQRIREAEDIWDLKREIALSEMYEALAQTARMSKKSELLAKAVRFRAYFKAAHLEQGNHTNGAFDETEERFMRDLAKVAEEVFEKLLEDGVENGNLAERLFRVSASKSTRGIPQNKADELDPRRFFLAFICDMRANPTYYSQVGAAKFLDDPRILENLDPIEEHYVNFSIAIIGALRARRAVAMEGLKAAANPV